MAADTEARRLGVLMAMIAAVTSAISTAVSLAVIALFSLGNLLEAKAWGSLGLMVAGLLAAVAAVPLSVMVGQAVLKRFAAGRATLLALGLIAAGAVAWSVRWMTDPGDWPFFGAPALVFALAAATLIVMSLKIREVR